MTAGTASRAALRFRLDSGLFSLPLERIHHLAGYAALSGTAEDYFLGWLLLHGEYVPVFDLNRVVCDTSAHETFGTRIMVVEGAAGAGGRYLGLLAEDVTDTVHPEDKDVTPLPLDAYLQMLYPLVPLRPGDAA